ncbi:MAG: Asp-tRNA(Asn)/Glu-tRNA(Gln) amidotransferase subunit GatC [Alphaproteobacteria bacterium]|jgi:aspartyl-tRNA(Asn)/glutamyl-tRNA(Gln) amidotransferase subunit C|nr:Asp-tRNA(Asn)/Glu-tRNA(Gln) amidotransferase subunit GatC [Alphaproteobacteria bacterium]MBT5827874.1 Asp-tRNA(Asn)/Glu-tRNA(Gln) amidotransferase subunit GatC [Alphaproteobacteria bacterium]
MSKVTEDQVKKIAKLARISLANDNLLDLSENISNIVTWVESLNEIDTDNVEPMMAIENDLAMRADDIADDNISDDILANAPLSKLNFFAVPKFVE